MGNKNQDNKSAYSLSIPPIEDENNDFYLHYVQSDENEHQSLNSSFTQIPMLEDQNHINNILKDNKTENDYLGKKHGQNDTIKEDLFSNDSKNLNTKNIRSGRKPKNGAKKNKQFHDKNSKDNILRIIQVHYISFIINLINDILDKLGLEEKFFDIDYQFKSNITKKNISILKKLNIGNILCQKISTKYKIIFKKDNEKNKSIFQEVTKKSIVIKNLLGENYLKLFREVYYKNKRVINLSTYGLNYDITLSKKVETFEDIFKKKHIKKNVNNAIKKKFNKVVVKKFLPNYIFQCD